MAEVVYILCALTSLACAGLLARAWSRTPSRLIFWSAVCFAGLALNNILLVIDLVVLPEYSLRLPRLLSAAAGLLALLWALIMDPE
jgi:hypothetical protein